MHSISIFAIHNNKKQWTISGQLLAIFRMEYEEDHQYEI